MKTKKYLVLLIILLSLAIFQGCLGLQILQAAASYEEERTVFIVHNGNYYHTADCKEIAHKQKTGIPHKQAKEKGYMRCPICDPD